MTTLLWKVVGSVMVVRENKETPSDMEWDAFIAATTEYRKRVDMLRVLIITDGGGPNGNQRSKIKDAIGDKQFKSAVVSDAIKIRFIASAIMLISKNHASFTTREASGAYTHLALTADERRKVDECVVQLDAELKRGAAPTSSART
jgi:hypothetical protein